MSIVIFDLDGTLANIEHRLHFVQNGNRQWDEFFAACADDKRNEPIIEIWDCMSHMGHEMWIFSGRSDQVLEETQEWLVNNNIFADRVFMRKAGDHQPDDKLKQGWLDELTDDERAAILCAFDDRQRIVDMWRRNGITCLQVAEGNF